MSEEIKVSEMQEAEEVNDEDIVMVIQKKVNKKAKIKQIKNELAVSPTQPTTREKVWFKIGKNKFNSDELPSQTTLGVTTSFNNSIMTINGTSKENGIMYAQSSTKIVLEAGTYTWSMNKKSGTVTRTTQAAALYLRKSGTTTNIATISAEAFATTNTKSRTFTLTERTAIDFYAFVNATGLAFNNLALEVQIEQGSTATTYEEYVEPKIYIKNDNDVYEEFISKENLDNYSTEEKRIGTWIDGKPLYRKVISGYWSFETGDTNIAHNISNLDLCIRADLFRIDTGHISWEFPYISASGGFTGITNVTPENVIVKAYNDTWSNKNNGYIILEYTKITD